MTAPIDAQTIEPLLLRWARSVVLPEARVADVAAMPGNSGLSFGFRVLGDGEQRLVVRLAPPGVRRSRNTDVLRQVPLLQALHRAGVPVATVRWWTDDENWFGTDAVVQEYIPALPLHLTDPKLGIHVPPEAMQPLLDRLVDTLVAIHSLPVGTLAGWEPVRSIETELAFWEKVLVTAEDEEFIRLGTTLRGHLHNRAPTDPRIGLFHGDYQPNNVLFDGQGQVAAVVDWEISGIGPNGMDLGWLSMMCDPSCWHPDYRERMLVVEDPQRLRARYGQTAGRQIDRPDWYQAFACYRFGAIAAFNLRLHRTGRRVDPLYDAMATSIPVLFRRGTDLVLDEEDDRRRPPRLR